MGKVYNMDDLDEKLGSQKEQKFEKVGLNSDDIMIAHEDLMAKPLTEVEFVLYPILPKKGYVLFHAEPGAGKTYFCLNLAYAIAQGGRFLKYAAPKPKKVLYVDAELGEANIRRRVDSIEKKQGKLYFDNLNYLFYDRFPNGEIPQIDTQAGRDFYTNHILKHGYEGVFLDNLLNLSGVDTNKATEWSPIQKWILALRNKGIFFFLLHHAAPGSSKQLGSCTRLTIADTVISLMKDGDDEKEGKLKVSYQKKREIPGNEKNTFNSFFAINNLDGSWSVEEIEPDLEKDIIYYHSQQNLKPMQIVRLFKDDGLIIHHSKVYRIIDRLKARGILR